MSSLNWNEIDKTRFFGLGTLWYSGLTIALHPITVLKTRQQVLSNSSTVSSLYQTHGVRSLYRGVGTVVCLAIPARVLYLGVLETSRNGLKPRLQDDPFQLNTVAATSLAGGMAGGLAAVSTQSLIVPMDVLSQRQMINGQSAAQVFRELEAGGLFRGFGLSILTSLPAGTVWWSVYSACQQYFVVTEEESHASRYKKNNPTGNGNIVPPEARRQHENPASLMGITIPTVSKELVISQVVSGVSAGLIAAAATQPLDVLKTRLQVSINSNKRPSSLPSNTGVLAAAVDLYQANGIGGFYRGVLPRMGHMSVWGTCLASLYELLRFVSRKT